MRRVDKGQRQPIVIGMLRILSLLFACIICSPLAQAVLESDTVTWTIGNDQSVLDGGAAKGPITFTWKFNQPVQQGVYLDGTPWVQAKPGLELIAVDPAPKRETVPGVKDESLNNALIDGTCINPREHHLPLDRRMGDDSGEGPWQNGDGVWDGQPTPVKAGDVIVTARSRRDSRPAKRKMVFTAIGVCNIVNEPQTGHYRPPVRMPAELRAKLEMPKQVDAASLPSFNFDNPRDWSGKPVTLKLDHAVNVPPDNVDADLLMNGPATHLGVHSHVWYETAGAMLNHDLRGRDDIGYHRNTADRIAQCLHTAFDPNVPLDKRQRSLNKFIQNGLDYYYMSALGYPVWNGGGGHPNGIEGFVTITGALVGDAQITEDMKYQRFSGAAVGQPDKVYDMLAGYPGSFARSEALYIVSPAPWQSGKFIQREIGNGADNLQECLIAYDFAREDHVINNRDVPFTKVEPVENGSAIFVSQSYHWPMHAENRATEATRSYRFLTGGVLRIDGDQQVRKIIDFQQSPGENWSTKTWPNAGGRGGVVIVHPALTAAEQSRFAGGGTFTTGLTTLSEIQTSPIVLWESWPADSEDRVRKNFFNSPSQDYLGIKVGDHFQWLPYYAILDDPGAPGQKLDAESATFRQVKQYAQMTRDQGQFAWDMFTSDPNVPDTPTIQALVMEYLLDDQPPEGFAKTYPPNDKMWTD